MSMLYNPFGLFISIFPVIMTALVFFIFATVLIRGVGQWRTNNRSPRLSVAATVVAKRQAVSHHTHHNAGDVTGAHGMYTTADTSYYVTFQVKSGDRMELLVRGTEYGLLAEGDTGELTFQGSRYLGFERS